MKASTVHEIKQELAAKKPAQLVELCLRLARFKKENKELLTYLLFEADDKEGYIRGVKTEIDELFTTINLSHMYFAKKTLRKIVRVINKYTRYSASKQTEIELRLHFAPRLKHPEYLLTETPLSLIFTTCSINKLVSLRVAKKIRVKKLVELYYRLSLNYYILVMAVIFSNTQDFITSLPPSIVH